MLRPGTAQETGDGVENVTKLLQDQHGLTLKTVGGGEITRIQLRSIKTIAKIFFTDFRMDSKFELVRRVLPQKI